MDQDQRPGRQRPTVSFLILLSSQNFNKNYTFYWLEIKLKLESYSFVN